MGRKPTNLEVATELGVSVDELDRRLRALHRAETVSLHTPVRDSSGDRSSPVEIGDSLSAIGFDRHDPEASAVADERTRVIRDAIRLLPEREQTILALVYVDGLTGREAGSVIGVTESRISQVLATTRLKLKHHIEQYDSAESSNLAA